jgi:hypothetical protein
MSHRMELLATCDVAGRPDTLQVMLFLLHNLFRFGVGGVTIEHYVRGIKAHLAPRLTPPLTGPEPEPGHG